MTQTAETALLPSEETETVKRCDNCALVGPIVYRGGERRCDFLMLRSAPEWITQLMNTLPRPTPNYGPPERAEECGAYEPADSQ